MVTRPTQNDSGEAERLTSSLLAYFTVPMWCTMIGVLVASFAAYEYISAALSSNLVLNGAMISILLIGAIRALIGNASLRVAARHLNALASKNETPSTVHKLLACQQIDEVIEDFRGDRTTAVQ